MLGNIASPSWVGLITLVFGSILPLEFVACTQIMSIQRCYKDENWKARKPTLWRHTWIQLITRHINVVSLPTHIHNSPTAWGPPPLELSIHVNEKPKFRTRVDSISVFPLISSIILITCCVSPSVSTKSVVWTKPWTEEQTNTQIVVNIEQG